MCVAGTAGGLLLLLNGARICSSAAEMEAVGMSPDPQSGCSWDLRPFSAAVTCMALSPEGEFCAGERGWEVFLVAVS